MSTDDVHQHRRSSTSDPATEHIRRLYDSPRLFAAVVIVMAGDVITTSIGLHLGLTEANPVVADAIETYGTPGMIALKAVGAAILLTFPLLSSRPRITFRACCVLYGGLGVVVVCWNTSLILTVV